MYGSVRILKIITLKEPTHVVTSACGLVVVRVCRLQNEGVGYRMSFPFANLAICHRRALLNGTIDNGHIFCILIIHRIRDSV